jgi:protein ImuB
MFACIYAHAAQDESALADFSYRFSPLVEITKPNTIVIDVEGCDLLFGSAYELANEIAIQAPKRKSQGGIETSVNVTLAANPDVAVHVAINLKGITFVATGEELACLGDFQIAQLDYSLIGLEKDRADVIFETFRLWGVRTFKDLAGLPVAGLSERLGQDGLRLQKLAAGKTERHLKLRQPAQSFANDIELDHPLAELEPLSFIFARLLNQLCASLNAYALATNELVVELRLEDQTIHKRTLSLPYPMRDHKVFLKLLLLDTEMHPPQAAVIAVSITCDPVKPRVTQNGLFVPLAPAPDKLELTLARLAKLVGEENVGSPALLDTHRPDAFAIKRFVLWTEHRKRKTSPNWQSVIGNRQSLGFRMFRPPLRAVVQADHGWPQQVSAWGKQRSVYGKVVQLAGPWRTTGEWWKTDSWCRDEWDIAVESDGRKVESYPSRSLYRVYRELDSGTWFVEGSYD